MTTPEVKLQLRSAEEEIAAMEAELATPVATLATRNLINAVFGEIKLEKVGSDISPDAEPDRDLPLRLSSTN